MNIKHLFKYPNKEIKRVILGYFMLAIPFLLILLNIKILTQDKFIELEYKKSSFPADKYGFTTEERIHYGLQGVHYLFNDQGIIFLSKHKLKSGEPLFNSRELRHMKDVKYLVVRFYTLGIFVFILLFLLGAYLMYYRRLTPLLFKGFLYSGISNIVTGIIGLLLCLTIFDKIFILFHKLLGFEGDSWMFYAHDSLIRIYPIKFWFDIFIYVFGGVFFESIIMVILGIYYFRFKKHERDTI